MTSFLECFTFQDLESYPLTKELTFDTYIISFMNIGIFKITFSYDGNRRESPATLHRQAGCQAHVSNPSIWRCNESCIFIRLAAPVNVFSPTAPVFQFYIAEKAVGLGFSDGVLVGVMRPILPRRLQSCRVLQ